MDVQSIAENIKNKSDFIVFLNAFISDYVNNKKSWENQELGTYIEAMERFLSDSTEESLEKIDFTPSWSLFAQIMITASIYE